MEEAVPDVDERVLVHVGVPDAVGSHVVVVVDDWNVVVGLVLRHDLRLHALTAAPRSACLFRGQENLTRHQLGQTGPGAPLATVTDARRAADSQHPPTPTSFDPSEQREATTGRDRTGSPSESPKL